ncbi:hypothetical protein BN1013_02071 [Candidatus Rubidus massiliensis]|nr:hypothetical protein BN1013_02071 [Candidatus Rubidus massiliensis]
MNNINKDQKDYRDNTEYHSSKSNPSVNNLEDYLKHLTDPENENTKWDEKKVQLKEPSKEKDFSQFSHKSPKEKPTAQTIQQTTQPILSPLTDYELLEKIEEGHLLEIMTYLTPTSSLEVQKKALVWTFENCNLDLLKILIEEKKFKPKFNDENEPNLFYFDIKKGSESEILLMLNYLKEYGLKLTKSYSPIHAFVSNFSYDRNPLLAKTILLFFLQNGASYKLNSRPFYEPISLLRFILNSKDRHLISLLKDYPILEEQKQGEEHFDWFLKSTFVSNSHLRSNTQNFAEEIFNIFYELHMPITQKGLIELVRKGENKLLEKFINDPEYKKIVITNSDRLWEEALIANDFEILNLLQRANIKFLDEDQFRSTLLKLGSTDILEWVHHNFPNLLTNLTNEFRAKLFQSCNCDLILKWLEINGKSLDESLRLIHETLIEPVKNQPQLFTEIVQRLFLLTDENTLNTLLKFEEKFYPDIAKDLKQVLLDCYEWGGLIARNKNDFITELFIKNYNIKNFYTHQVQFAKTVKEKVEGLTTFFEKPKVTLKDCFDYLTSWRATDGTKTKDKKLIAGAAIYRFNLKQYAFTPIGYSIANGNRYAKYTPQIEQMFQAVKKSELPGIIEDKVKEENDLYKEDLEKKFEQSFTLLYPYKGEKIEMTKMIFYASPLTRNDEGWGWMHTSNTNINKLWPHFEEIHLKIIDFKLDQNEEELHALIAQAYWLGSNLMITERGNAQNMLIFLAAWYKHHKFSSPIIDIEIGQLDCIAISTPFEHFQNKFLTYFSTLPTLIAS